MIDSQPENTSPPSSRVKGVAGFGDSEICHHIDDADLMAYASGNSPELLSLLIATHLTLCGRCRDTIDLLEAVGGHLFDEIVGADVATTDDATSVVSAMAQTLDVIATDKTDVEEPSDGKANPVRSEGTSTDHRPTHLNIGDFPLVLQSYIGRNFDSQKWKRLLAGVESWRLIDDASGLQASLMRVDAGRVMPRHTHQGRELTLILAGSMLDRDVVYRRGDVVEADQTTRHQPRAGEGEDCVCLAVLEGDVVLTNPLYQMLSKILPS